MLFQPRLDSHFSLSALPTEIITPVLSSNERMREPKYNVTMFPGLEGKPTSFKINIYKKESVLVEGTEKMKKIVHEVVASLLGVETDVKLKTIGVTGGDSRLSPDYISKERKMIVELTTTVNVDPRNVEERFQQKVVHYRDALEGTGFEIGVLVVGETFVYTNLAMSQQMVDALCQRCRVGIAIKSRIERSLGYSLNPTDTSKEETLVINTIKSMKKEAKSSKEFPMSDIMSCSGKPTKKDFSIAAKILKKELSNSKKKSPESPQLLTDYLNSYNGNSRVDMKRISNVPLIEPVLSEIDQELEMSDITDSNMPVWLKKIWSASLDAPGNPDLSAEELRKDAVRVVDKEDESKHKVQKNSSFNVRLTSEDLEEASTTGLFGKSQKASKLYKENKEKNKRSFHPLNTPVHDIEDFINKTNMLSKTHINPISSPIRNLIHDAKSTWGVKGADNVSTLMLRNIAKTRLINYAMLITNIFTEICYCYKYWIGRSDFYIKEAQGVKILIRCTGTHMFCSFAFPKDFYNNFDTGRLGPTVYESDMWYFTDISSYTEPVVEHFVKAGPYMASIVCHQMCSMELDMTENLSINKVLSKDMNGILLLYLNNKTDAEEVMTSQRYLTMGVLEDLDPNPYRFVERLPEFIKSRLTAYLVKRTSNLMTRYSTPPIRMLVKEGDQSTVEYDGLVSFFSNEPISFKRKIEEFYYGYVISKEKGRGGDRNFKIMKKIVQQEYVYRDNNYSEFSNTSSTKTNQTNIPVMKVLCHLMKERMKMTYGVDWESVLEKKIIERLSKITFTELATLKVSSRNYEGTMKVPHVDDSMTTQEITEKLKLMNPEDVLARPRVMESLTALIEKFKAETNTKDVSHIIQLVPWCLSKIESRGFFFSDIFPKPQHGGDREIHVLEITMRVCQLFVEHIARSLCEMTPSDTLMHPKWKSTFVKNHYSRSESDLESHRITMGKSADAAKWCQRNHASKFAAALSSFLPTWILKPVLRVLKLWTTKVICFPIQFVSNFLSNKSVKSNPIYERMRSEFFSGTGIFKDAVSNRMIIKSGMMQGILHYLSSFVHGIIQEASVILQSRVLKSRKVSSVITMAQGSDDSAELISLSGLPIKKLMRLAVTMLHWKENISKHIGIYTSRAKSCIGSSDMIEYNSEWYTRQNSIMPTFRWVSACLEVGIVEKFIDRVHNFYGTVTNVIEAGGKILEASVIQECQAWFHYHMLGLSSHKLSSDVSEMLCEVKDPALGYFPLDSDVNAGVTGVDFQLFKMHRDTDYGFGVGANRLKNYELEMFDEDGRDPAVAQSLRRIRLKFGNNKIFSNLLRRMSAPELEQIIKEVEKNPSILYYPPRGWNSSKLNIFMKLFEPGVKESLSRHSATARVLSASAYMISRPCFSTSTDGKRTSLYKALLQEKYDRIVENSVKIETSKVFIYHDEYEDTLNDIQSILDHSVFQRVNMKSRSKQTIQVFDRVLSDIPIIEMCKERWFEDGRTGLTSRQFVIKWIELTDRFSFLKNSREETREHLGLSEIQLKNFLVSIDTRPRKLTLMDTAARGSSVKSTMTRLFWPNIKLLKTGLDVEEEETASSLRSKIFSVMTHWSSYADKKKKIAELLSTSMVLKQKTVPSRLRKLKCIHDSLTGSSNSKILDDIISEKVGSLGIFTIRQNGWGKNRSGLGEWKGMVLSSKVKIELDGPVCTGITVTNLKNQSDLGKALSELLKNIGSSYPKDLAISDYWLTPDGKINGGRGVMSAIPITVDKDMKVTIFDDMLDWEWFMDINETTIRLRANAGDGFIATLLSDTFKAYEWDPIYKITDKIYANWNNSDPMNAEEIAKELSSFFNGSDSHTLKEINKIRNGDKSAVSSSGWLLEDFSRVLKNFFSLRFSAKDAPESIPEDIEDPSEDIMLYFQTGDFDLDLNIADTIGFSDDDCEFDVNFNVEDYIDDNLELLLTEREVSNKQDSYLMPPTNRCLNSLDGLSRALTNMSIRELYTDCIQSESKKLSGLMGKIMTLVTGTPRVLRQATHLERTAHRHDEDSISATMSLRTIENMNNLNTEELISNIDEIDVLLSSAKVTIVRESLLQSRTRLVNILNLLDVKQEDNGVTSIATRDFILWFRDNANFFNEELNVLYRLTDSSFILAIRDRLDSQVDLMCKNAAISEYELSLYREAIPKAHLTTLFLDVFSHYTGLCIKVGPYVTMDQDNIDIEYNPGTGI